MTCSNVHCRRGYAWVVGSIGRAIASSYFSDLQKRFSSRVTSGIVLVGLDDDIAVLSSSLQIMEEQCPAAFRVVCRYIRAVAMFDRPFPRASLCNGVVFIRRDPRIPATRVSAYLVRLAIQVRLYQQFKMYEVLLGDAHLMRLSYQKELAIMIHLNCGEPLISEQRAFIERCGSKQNRPPNPPPAAAGAAPSQRSPT